MKVRLAIVSSLPFGAGVKWNWNEMRITAFRSVIESEMNDKMAVVPYKWMIDKMEMDNKMAVVPL